MTYNVYIPIVHSGGTKPKIHSFQVGWDNEDRVEQYQDLLGLTGGFDQYLLGDYPLITVQIEEWYTWYNLTYGEYRGVIEPHPLVYSKATRSFPREAEAIAWIQAHPGKSYIIGNEPDCDLSEGECANCLSEAEFADFLHKSIQLIRGADPKAYIIVGAWAGGIGEVPSFSHNENDMIKIYYSRYGSLKVDAFSFHVYQRDAFNNPYPVNKLSKFTQFAKIWKSKGWTDTTDTWLTEFGWSGLDSHNNTIANNIAFMDWYIPQLKANPQIKAYFWWEWNNGSMLVENGKATELGRYYSDMR